MAIVLALCKPSLVPGIRRVTWRIWMSGMVHCWRETRLQPRVAWLPPEYSNSIFPFPRAFSWNRELAAESARKLRNLKPTRLAVGHGKTIESPLAAMDRAVELAFKQCGKMLN